MQPWHYFIFSILFSLFYSFNPVSNPEISACPVNFYPVKSGIFFISPGHDSEERSGFHQGLLLYFHKAKGSMRSGYFQILAC